MPEHTLTHNNSNWSQ